MLHTKDADELILKVEIDGAQPGPPVLISHIRVNDEIYSGICAGGGD
jgi:hypothetical protein